MQYVLYLRKSRADREAEMRGEGETLARHEKTLLDFAKRQQLTVKEIYREIVSGETIASRPMMQKLLSEVEQGVWDGVLVMEVERLARGDTIDQGIVAQAFKLSNTQIITPIKTYDPNNEFDEEYFEFGLFMSRREYKTITRRLNNGRQASVKEGKYVGNIAPYGYERVKIEKDKGYTLKPLKKETNVINMIFHWYAYHEYSIAGIAEALNQMQLPSRSGKSWCYTTIRDMLQNPVYIGKVRWGLRGQKKQVKDGKITIHRPRSTSYLLCDGLHPAIVDKNIFDMVQNRFSQHKPLPTTARKMKNPFAGLILCAKCGSKMQRRPYQRENIRVHLLCPNPQCHNVSAPFDLVEQKILRCVMNCIDIEKLQCTTEDNTLDEHYRIWMKQQIMCFHEEIRRLKKQEDHIHDLLEQGLYDQTTFMKRIENVHERLSEIEKREHRIQEEVLKEETKREETNLITANKKTFSEIYDQLSISGKNAVLKEILYSVEYERDISMRNGGTADNFTLILHPRLHDQRVIDG